MHLTTLHRVFCAIVAIACALACTTSSCAIPQASGTPVTNGVISVFPGKFELGDIEPGSEHARTFILKNDSQGPVVVQRTVTTCKCTSTTNIDGVTIAPGGTLEFEAVLKAPRTPGIKNAKVQVFFGNGSRPLTVELEGDVTMPIKATPAYVGGPRGKQMSGVVQVASVDGRPFKILSAGNEPPRYSGFNPATDEPRSKYTLRWDIARIADLPRNIWWVVYTDHPDCPVLPLRIRNAETGAKSDQARFQRHWIYDENIVNAQALQAGVPVQLDVVIKHYNPRARGAIQQPDWLVTRGMSTRSTDAEVALLSATPLSEEEVRVVFSLTPRRDFSGPMYVHVTLQTATGSGEFAVLALVSPSGG